VSSTALARAIDDLVIANRIIAHEGVVDALGHVSLRHPEDPDRFLLSRSRSPALVTREDIMSLDHGCHPSPADERPLYLERFIHGAIYAARPDVMAVIHSHAHEVLPYTVSSTPLRPVINTAGVIGAEVPVWDIRSKFGDATNLLVTNGPQGTDLAARLGGNSVVLMRGHGFTAAGRSLIDAIRISIYLKLNAAVLSVTYLSEGEIAAMQGLDPNAPELQRVWQYWAARAGCTDMLG